MMSSNIIQAGVFTENEELRIRLCESVHSPGLNPQNTFLLLATLLDREFADKNDKTAPARFLEFVRTTYPSGMGLEARDLLKIVFDLKHPHEIVDQQIKAKMKNMRQQISRLLTAADPQLKEEQVARTPTVAVNGEIGRGRKRFDKSKNVKPNQGGNSKEYRLGVIKRDYPEIAARYADGEFKSVSAAERAAGIRSIRKGAPLAKWKAIWQKATPKERQEIYNWCSQELNINGKTKTGPETCRSTTATRSGTHQTLLRFP